MKGIVFSRLADAQTTFGYAARTCDLAGEASSSLGEFVDFGLWVVRADLAPEASLTWGESHGDEALYVESGELLTDVRICSQGGVVVVEAGAPATVVAPAGASVVHFGPLDPEPPSDGYYGPPADGPRRVHVVAPEGTYSSIGPWRDTRLFADSTCATCRISLYLVARDNEYISTQHSHSVDEVIYVIRGHIRFGNQHAGPGDAVAVAASRRYAFRSGSDGFAFLNYRRDASEQTIAGDVPQLEGGEARGLTLVKALD